jgi:hypothetical protein
MSITARSLLPPLIAAMSIVYPAGSLLSIAAGDAVRSSCRSLSVPLPGPITARCSLPSSMFPFHSMSERPCLSRSSTGRGAEKGLRRLVETADQPAQLS